MKRHIVVQKFGGSSVASPEKIGQVAQFIKLSLVNKPQICVVVSAMGHTTNDLLTLAHTINPHPPKRELDMLISCGERSSMALLAMALAHIDVKAISLTGSQSGIITDEQHNGAEIIAIRPERVLNAFKDYDVVIIAGFQGISREREITTLKRGGSDTTAVAMAAALEAQACEIYTDVPGVLDADPKIVACAKPLDELEHRQMSSMSLYGAKVLAHDAARIAEHCHVDLLIAKSSHGDGTTIKEIAIKKSSRDVVSMSHLRGVMRVSLDLARATLDWQSYFLCGRVSNNCLEGYVSNDIAQELPHDTAKDGGFALITLQIGCREHLMKTMQSIGDIFSTHLIAVSEMFVGFNELFIVVHDEALVKALELLHQTFLGEHT